VAALVPIQARYHELMADPAYLDQLLKTGNVKARAIANETLKKVKAALGFSAPL